VWFEDAEALVVVRTTNELAKNQYCVFKWWHACDFATTWCTEPTWF